jgi:biotin carboxylase
MNGAARLLLIASKAGYQTEAFSAAAARQNVELDLATNRCHHLDDPWRDGALAIDFDHPELADRRWDGIAAVGDHASEVAAILAERFGLRYHPLNAVRACRSKFETRERFQNARLLTPLFWRIPLKSPSKEDVPFPCVLKPLGLSASRGVIRANNSQEFEAAFLRITRLLTKTPDLARHPSSEYILVEEFIPGREFAIEGIMTRGCLKILTIFDKPDPLDGPFFEETIYTTPSRAPESIERAIRETCQQAVTALGLADGPIHAECRVNDRGVWMLEIAARPIGGLCARVLRFTSGLGLEELIIRHAIGQPVDLETLAPEASAVMMIPIPQAGIYQGVRGVEEASRLPGVESVEITAVPGQMLVPLPEGASYLGFIFVRATTPVQAEARVRAAHSKLSFDVQTALRLMK